MQQVSRADSSLYKGEHMQAQINGIELHYQDGGTGRPLLLVHGFPLNAAMWEAQQPLAESSRLVVPDLRGFGATQAPSGAYTMDLYADDLASLLDHLGIDRAVVCGLSMGGYVALAFARRHPTRL